jgi:hypothetical protein
VRIFVDTNIFLDILFKRNDYEAALAVFKAVKHSVYDGVVADITIINIDYISRKVEHDIHAYLELIERSFNIVGANNSMIKEALTIDNKDIEDNIQYVLSKDENCDCIITNDKGFYNGEITLYNARTFVDSFLKDV